MSLESVQPEPSKRPKKSKRKLDTDDAVDPPPKKSNRTKDDHALDTEVVPDRPTKKSKKQKNQSDNTELSLASDGVPSTTGEGESKGKKKDKKKKSRSRDADVAAEPVESTQVDGRGLPVTKVDEVHADAQQAGASTSTTPSKETKTRKKRAQVAENEGQDGRGVPGSAAQDTSETKTKKKRKRKDADADAQVADGVDDGQIDLKRKKKKRKGESTTASGFVDPEEDASLSEQAKKTLGYAFQRFEDPTSWKFNKARQNWLVRNILSGSGDSIPDTHAPLVVKYLSDVQGGVREALIKTCRELLAGAASAAATASDPASGKEDSEAAPTNSDTRWSRAHMLLEKLGG